MSDAAATSRGSNGTSKAGRRKVRKGTRSCWECRRRKMKCTFDSPGDDTCLRCTRRGVRCVGQEQPEVISTPLDRSLQMGDRIVRVEALVDQILKQASGGFQGDERADTTATGRVVASPAAGLPSPESPHTAEPGEQCASNRQRESSGLHILYQGTYTSPSGNPSLSSASTTTGFETLSRALHNSLPSEEDIGIIARSTGDTSSLFYVMNMNSYSVLERCKAKPLQSLFEKPNPNAHPVLIARLMLFLATTLQHLHPDFYDDVRGLSEAPRVMMKRLVDTAMEKVTSDDNLIASAEGLDCVIIESWFHANAGDLRRALVTIRRAMTIAQVMGFHKSRSFSSHARLEGCNTTTNNDADEIDPELMWLRIVSVERYLCLMLGVPQGTLDKSMASEEMLASDTPMAQLDRIHCSVASRVLERNQTDPEAYSDCNYTLTKELDDELKRASRKLLPPGWWLMPNLATGDQDPERLFWLMRQLFHQLFHYSLLIQLHLPYMVRCSSSSSDRRKRYSYSWITCVQASREILSRLIMFHSHNRIAFSCRTVDFFGLTAAITLLMAHLDRRRHPDPDLAESLLAHRRPCDIALVERAREKIGAPEGDGGGADVMSSQCSELLGRLLDMEAEGGEVGTRNDCHDTSMENVNVVRLSIPYFGLVDVTTQGIFPVPNHNNHRVTDISPSAARSTTTTGNSEVSSAQNTDTDTHFPAHETNVIRDPVGLNNLLPQTLSANQPAQTDSTNGVQHTNTGNLPQPIDLATMFGDDVSSSIFDDVMQPTPSPYEDFFLLSSSAATTNDEASCNGWVLPNVGVDGNQQVFAPHMN